ncbi:hypothetical protein [Thalassotalea montiporae]
MKKMIMLISVVTILSGCVSTKNVRISQQDLKQLNPNNLALTKREKPDFAAMTAGKAMFALVGAAAMIAAGNDIVEENSIEDPASYIQGELAKELTKNYGFKLGKSKNVTTSKSKKISEEFQGSDLVLDVETVNWSFVYYPSDWDNYRVIYSAKLRLFDTKTESVIAEGFCSRVPENIDTAPSHDELLDNNAALIKQELKIAANTCIDEFKTNVFSFPA